MNKLEKNRNISNSFKATKIKRESQVCKVFTVKVDKSSLNKLQKEQLKMMFVEAKWIYNFILDKSSDSDLNIFDINYKDLKEITHKDKDFNDINVSLSYLGSSIKQELIKSIISNIKSLSSLKKKGFKIGNLKFKSEFNSLSLKQLNVTHSILGHKIKVQGIKKALRVNGLKQLKRFKSLEVANAKLIQRNGDFYVALTTFISKNEINKKLKYDNEILGIDFGCKTNLTFSNGTKISCIIEESESLKKLQRKLSRQKKNSNNYFKTLEKIKKHYQKISNKKNDVTNKICNKILNENQTIVIQDEQLQKWSRSFGKTIQHSILGRLKSKLISSSQVIVLSKWVPTTKFCPCCGSKLEMSLKNRTFECSCGLKEDRDVHAAKNMVWFYKNIIGVEHSKFKLVEFNKNLEQKFLKPC